MRGPRAILQLLLLLAAGLLFSVPGRAAEDPAATESEIELPPLPGAVTANPKSLVQLIYGSLVIPRPDPTPLITAMNVDALLERTVESLSARPPEAWMAAARKRLAEAEHRVEWASGIFDGGYVVAPRVLSVQADDLTATVNVRYISLNPHTDSRSPAWHQVHLAKGEAGWRVVDIHVLASGDRLSYSAVQILNDAKNPLPLGSSRGIWLATLWTLLAGALAAVILGLGAYFALVRPSKGRGRRGLLIALNWFVVLGPLLAGTGIFLSRLNDHLAARGAVDELARRASGDGAIRQALQVAGSDQAEAGQFARQRCEQAREAWPGNHMGMLLEGRLLVAQAGASQAESYLQALADEQMADRPPGGLLELARFYRKRRAWKQAAASVLAFADVVGPDAYIHCLAAGDYARAGRFKDADVQLQKAEAVQRPLDDFMLLRRMKIRGLQKRAGEVVKDAEIIKEMYRGDPRIFPRLAQEFAGEEFDAVRKDPAFMALHEEVNQEAAKLQQMMMRMREQMQRSGGTAP